ncbi:MAG: alpha/beta hydrolase [Microbacterium sp.]
MDIILVPGLWLDASSWDGTVRALEAAGHRARPLTMPGVGEPAAQSSDIGITDWVAATVAEIDRAASPVVLVGHSGGGNVVWGAADARPDRVARVIFVDTVPPAPGCGISEFEVTDGVIPFPGWEFFGDEAADIPADAASEWAARAKSVPAKVPTDEISLTDERRFDVPVTLLMGGADEAELRAQLAEWGPWADEFGAIRSVEVVKLGTGHWPQFSQPAAFERALVAVVPEPVEGR